MTTETTRLVDVLMPQMGASVVEGTVIAWTKSVGELIELDETICEVSTDKIDTECPSPAAGTIVEFLADVGDTIEVGGVMARIAVAGNGDAAPPSAPPLASSPSGTATGGGDVPAIPGPRVSPVVARIAAHHGLDLSAVSGSGRNGRITKRDALAAVENGSSGATEPLLHSDSPYRPDAAMAPRSDSARNAPPGGGPAPSPAPTPAPAGDLGGVTTTLSRMRQRIGGAMRNSLETAATCHTIVECDMSAVELRRRELGVTALPLVARSVIDTLREFPDLNATLDGTTITHYERVHLGVAVSLGEAGLIVPVIHDAQNLAPEGLGASIRRLAGSARAGQLSPDDVGGASFTITNPGAFGALAATPIIDVPQVAILDLEAIVRRPVVILAPDGTEAIAIRPMVNLILGWDHRAVDGVYAARFLTALRGRLEHV